MKVVATAAVAFLLAAAPSVGTAPPPGDAATVADPTALLPGDGFAPGWARSGSLSRYRGAELYGHINGGAELFLELGFEQAVVQEYVAGEDELVAEVYAMSDAVAAAGIYLFKCGAEERHSALTGRHSFTQRQVLLFRGSFYVILYAVTPGEAATTAMVAAAAAIAQLLPDQMDIPLADRLPVAGRVGRSERLLRGQFTLQRVFTLGDGDVLSLGGAIPAVAADYDDGQGGTFTLIVTDYPDDKTAKSAFEHLSARLDPAISKLGREPTRTAFRDWAGKYGVATLSGSRVEVRVNLPDLP